MRNDLIYSVFAMNPQPKPNPWEESVSRIMKKIAEDRESVLRIGIARVGDPELKHYLIISCKSKDGVDVIGAYLSNHPRHRLVDMLPDFSPWVSALVYCGVQ